jgi:hypothetical protein
MQVMACQSRLGESRGPATHLSVRSPNALTVHVATRRFDSIREGMVASSAAPSLVRS